MSITRDVITDLWPVYASGEASADTRTLVENFLQQDPDFAKLLAEGDEKDLLGRKTRRLPTDNEVQALRKTKRVLHGWDWTFFFATLFSCFAFGRIVSDTSWDVSPRNFIITAAIAGTFWITYLVRMIWVRRRVYRIKS